MKERPIIFNSEMVRAILAGRKTQTRRVIKWSTAETGEKLIYFGKLVQIVDHFDLNNINFLGESFGEVLARQAPLGQPGDHLWVRETFWQRCDLGINGTRIWTKKAGGYCATDKRPGERFRKRASIHMPKWASRITLGITSVRVERLQNINEEDAKAEGCQPISIFDRQQIPLSDFGGVGTPIDERPKYKWGFAELWDSISKQKEKWRDNPWVWVYEFKKVT